MSTAILLKAIKRILAHICARCNVLHRFQLASDPPEKEMESWARPRTKESGV